MCGAYQSAAQRFSAGGAIAAPAGQAPATVANGGISSSDAAIKAYNYLDLSAAVRLAERMTFRVGVNNVLDKDPPVIGGSNLPGVVRNGNTFPPVYDALGRFIFGQLTVQF